MPENNTVERAEQRVREMDRVTRQFSEQGNRYMRDMQNRRNVSAVPREAQNVHNAKPEKKNAGRQSNTNENMLANMQTNLQANRQSRRQIGNMSTRFEPVERKNEIAEEKALPKREEKNIAEKGNGRAAGNNLQSFRGTGIDGERLLLIALMYLLITENADIKLILAIGYLIL